MAIQGIKTKNAQGNVFFLRHPDGANTITIDSIDLLAASNADGRLAGVEAKQVTADASIAVLEANDLIVHDKLNTVELKVEELEGAVLNATEESTTTQLYAFNALRETEILSTKLASLSNYSTQYTDLKRNSREEETDELHLTLLANQLTNELYAMNALRETQLINARI